MPCCCFCHFTHLHTQPGHSIQCEPNSIKDILHVLQRQMAVSGVRESPYFSVCYMGLVSVVGGLCFVSCAH